MSANTCHLNIATVKATLFWLIVLLSAAFFTAPVYADDEQILAQVSSSLPYYGKNQKYSKQCLEGTSRCWLIGEPPKYYATTFTNGRQQFTILTLAQFPHDLWFDVVRNCDTGKCYYHSAILSEYQSPETLAIQEILQREQHQYLNNPHRLY
jgi:hypothetical protein